MILKEIMDYFKNLGQYDQSICVGDQLVYKGLSHGSVGISFILEYDKAAFTQKWNYSYTDPDMENLPRGDEEIAVCTLTALKAGKFVIKEIENFRDEQITVKGVHVIKVHRKRQSC